MAAKKDNTQSSSSIQVYQIRIKGHLDAQWASWFAGLTITQADNGETLLSGPVIDQAALHGLLRKIRDLGLPLISFSPISPGQTAAHIED
jgi:hypothetical protein